MQRWLGIQKYGHATTRASFQDDQQGIQGSIKRSTASVNRACAHQLIKFMLVAVDRHQANWLTAEVCAHLVS